MDIDIAHRDWAALDRFAPLFREREVEIHACPNDIAPTARWIDLERRAVHGHGARVQGYTGFSEPVLLSLLACPGTAAVIVDAVLDIEAHDVAHCTFRCQGGRTGAWGAPCCSYCSRIPEAPHALTR